MKETPSSAKEWLLRALGMVLLVLGVAVGLSRVHAGGIGAGVDFAVLHVMGVGIARGANVYQQNDPGASRESIAGVAYPPGAMGVVVYPPVTGFAMLPLAVLPFSIAKIIWFVLINATVVLGIRALVRAAAPALGPHAWMIASGVVLLSAAIRWGMMLLQGAPLVLGLLCFFVAALHDKRPGYALAIAVFVTAFKMTLALPFLGLLLLHRRFAAVAISGGTWLMLNVLGFVRMGPGALAAYQRSAAVFEANDPSNINSPNPWTPVSLPRLDWVSLFYGVTANLSLARMASLACSIAVLLWLVREGFHTRLPLSLWDTTVFVAPLVCLGSLCVYHHQYDLCLFFAPLLLAVFGSGILRQSAWALALIAPLVFMILLLPIGTAESVAESILGIRGVGLLKLTFPTALTLALAGSLVILRGRAGSPENQALPGVAPAP